MSLNFWGCLRALPHRGITVAHPQKVDLRTLNNISEKSKFRLPKIEFLVLDLLTMMTSSFIVYEILSYTVPKSYCGFCSFYD